MFSLPWIYIFYRMFILCIKRNVTDKTTLSTWVCTLLFVRKNDIPLLFMVCQWIEVRRSSQHTAFRRAKKFSLIFTVTRSSFDRIFWSYYCIYQKRTTYMKTWPRHLNSDHFVSTGQFNLIANKRNRVIRVSDGNQPTTVIGTMRIKIS